MKSKKLADYSLTELIAKRKKTKTVCAVLGGFMLVAVPALCYGAYLTKNIALVVVGIGSLVPIGMIVTYLSQIDKEIKLRSY